MMVVLTSACPSSSCSLERERIDTRSGRGRLRVLLDEPLLLEFVPEIFRDRRLHRIPVLLYLPFTPRAHYERHCLGRGRRELQGRCTQIDAVTFRHST